MRSNYIVMFLSVVLLGCNTYNISDKPELRNVSVVSDSARIYATVLLKPFKDELKNNLQYSWYSSDLIGANYGGFNGCLLDGSYKKVSLSGRLLEQGTFINGLRNGVWKYWYSNGNLKRIEKWSKGVNGNLLEYDKDGALIISKDKTIASEKQTQSDTTGIKAPWYKRVLKKTKKSPQ